MVILSIDELNTIDNNFNNLVNHLFIPFDDLLFKN